MTFLVDANILIDLGYVQGLELLPQIGPSEVLDVVLLECQTPPDLIAQVHSTGIQEIESQTEWIIQAQPFKTSRLSLQDSLNFYYARTFQRTLLTNEKPLRNLCERENVNCHGLLWMVQQAAQRQLYASQRLCDWLLPLEQLGSRFPRQALADLRQTLQC